MNKPVALSIIIVLCWSVLATAVAPEYHAGLNGDAGDDAVFRDLKWGDPVSALGGAERWSAKDGIETFVRFDEDYSLGPLKADSIVYAYFQNRLLMINFWTRDFDKTERLLLAKYGEPYQSSDIAREASWVSGETIISLTYDTTEQKPQVILGSSTLLAEYRNWLEAAAENDAKDAW